VIIRARTRAKLFALVLLLATPARPICQASSKCGDGAEVILCSPNTGHVLYGDAAKEMAAVLDLAWEVYQRHVLP